MLTWLCIVALVGVALGLLIKNRGLAKLLRESDAALSLERRLVTHHSELVTTLETSNTDLRHKLNDARARVGRLEAEAAAYVTNIRSLSGSLQHSMEHSERVAAERDRYRAEVKRLQKKAQLA